MVKLENTNQRHALIAFAKKDVCYNKLNEYIEVPLTRLGYSVSIEEREDENNPSSTLHWINISW